MGSTVFEGGRADCSGARRNIDAPQLRAALEGIGANLGQPCSEIHLSHCRAAIECLLTNDRHARGDRDASQIRTILERGSSDCCGAIPNTDFGQARAAGERPIPDRIDATWNPHLLQIYAGTECVIAKCLQTLRQDDADEVLTP